MGLFGGDNEPQQTDTLADQQIRQNEAELEQKKQALTQNRLDIIKSQGAEQWTPRGGMPGKT